MSSWTCGVHSYNERNFGQHYYEKLNILYISSRVFAKDPETPRGAEEDKSIVKRAVSFPSVCVFQRCCYCSDILSCSLG